MNEHSSHGERRHSRHGFFAGALLGGVAATLVVGGLGLAVTKVGAANLWKLGHGQAHGSHHGRMSLKDPEAARMHARFVMDGVLGHVDATDEQTEVIRGIVDRSIESLIPLVQQHREAHAALVAEITSTTIDRDAIERIRAAQLAGLEQASQVLANALADTAEALTPEQRTELLHTFERLHHR